MLREVMRALGGDERPSGVDLLPRPREDGSYDNASILESLRDTGRAFADVGPNEAERIAQAAAAEAERRIAAVQAKAAAGARREQQGKAMSGAQARATALLSGAKTEETRAAARSAAAATWRAAMREYMEIVTEHIQEQTGPDGAPLESPSLSPDYAARKQRAVGYTLPIGKRSGQLLENLNASIASGKIRLRYR